MILTFGVWSPDEATFWASWVARGICTEAGKFAAAYSGIETTHSWGGQVVQTPAVMDGMKVVTPAVLVSGWHCNVRVSNPTLVAQMTAGLTQTDADGKLLSIWDRTYAAKFFGLSPVDMDKGTLFPAGMMGDPKFGVRYCDPSAFKSPSNVWA